MSPVLERMGAMLLGLWLSAASVAALELPIPERPGRPGETAGRRKPVVVVFDFVSAYDGNRMGKFVSKNMWAKLDRSGKCVLVERADVNAVVDRAEFTAKFDDKSTDIVAFASEKFGASHVVWGTVEEIDRTGPVSERALSISVRSASVEDKGRALDVDLAMPVQNQREVQLATKEAVRLFFKIERPTPEVGRAEALRWRTGPNLVKNPGFERGTVHPQFWEPLDKSYHHRCVSWVASPAGKGKCVKFVLPESIAATYGVAYYSDPISIKDGELYRFSIRVRTDGPQVKIFLKHYAWLPAGPNESQGQWRETRRAPLNCKGENHQKGEWYTYTRDFHPHRDDRFDPVITRVELYAYWPKGVVYFDDVVLKKLKDRPAGKAK